jgi:hypothetical protein
MAPMKPWLVRAALVLAGFALWAGFSLIPVAGGAVIIREAWDRAPYWQIGVPLLLVAQTAIAAASTEKIARLPQWTLAGHFLGMVLVRPWGMDFGLLPQAFGFVGLPAYGALIAASWTGHRIGGLLQRA